MLGGTKIANNFKENDSFPLFDTEKSCGYGKHKKLLRPQKSKTTFNNTTFSLQSCNMLNRSLAVAFLLSNIYTAHCRKRQDMQQASDGYDYFQHYPKQYVAKRVGRKNGGVATFFLNKLDGDPDTKEEWKTVPYSEAFVDITGEPENPKGPEPGCDTVMKMLYDDQYLYVAAKMQYAGRPIIAKFEEENDPIYQKDSDFEVFVDMHGTCHAYKELELNAWNVTWNLMLNRPYADGGAEFSGRVTEPRNNKTHPKYWGPEKQRTFTKLRKGQVNGNASDVAEYTTEIALSWADLLDRTPQGGGASGVVVAQDSCNNIEGSTSTTTTPAGTTSTKQESSSSQLPRWIRINFSRVEDQGDKNWVWSPMITYDASKRDFRGFVDMHRPEAWGYVYLDDATSSAEGDADHAESVQNSTSGSSTSPVAQGPPQDPSFPVRLVAAHLYYAQRAYKDARNGTHFATSLSELRPYTHPDDAFLEPFEIEILSSLSGSFTVKVTDLNRGWKASIDESRLMLVESIRSEFTC
ncbi:unnamed protein product [Amoebophrya sp. A25]|nr:unnamed protein product [Amoebophrya sp. A25]|eukprot:GSA25T00001595001.1